jgi:hypothetical protein
MYRRSLGSARRLALVAGLLLVIGSILPWYQQGGGTAELPTRLYTAFDGTGFASFLAGLATLALLALPYALGDRPAPLDHWVSFGALAVVAILGVVLWVPTSGALADPSGLLPTRAYGFWIELVGAVLLGRAAFEVFLSRDRR